MAGAPWSRWHRPCAQPGVLHVRLALPPLALAVAIGFGLYILLRFLETTLWVWVLVLLALILSAAMMPAVELLGRPRFPPGGWRIPRGVAVVVVYLGIALAVVFGGYLIGGLIFEELLALSAALPVLSLPPGRLIEEVARSLHLLPGLIPSREEITSRLAAFTVGLAATIVPSFVTFIIRFFIVLTLAAFLVVESERAIAFWVSLFPLSQREKVRLLTTHAGRTMGHWVIGALAESSLVGTLSAIVAAILGLPAPVILGVIAAIIELVPMTGPMLMIIPAFLLGLLQSPVIAIIAGLAFFAIAQLDASIFAPTIARWAVRLSPLVVIVAIPLGAALYGAIGALISIPVAAALQIFTVEVVLPWLHRQEEGERGEHERPPEELQGRAA